MTNEQRDMRPGEPTTQEMSDTLCAKLGVCVLCPPNPTNRPDHPGWTIHCEPREWAIVGEGATPRAAFRDALARNP